MSRLSILFASSLVAGAMGLPSNLLGGKRDLSNRDVVTDYDYVTDYVTKTVYENEEAPAPATEAPAGATGGRPPWSFSWPHHGHHSYWTQSFSHPVSVPQASTTATPVTQITVTPTTQVEASSVPAPEPTSTQVSSPVATPPASTPETVPAQSTGGNANVPTACSTGSTWPASWNIPTPTADTNVNTYYGGASFPFEITQDEAPKLSGDDYVDLHNRYRAFHGAVPMTKNQTLEDVITQSMAGGSNCPNGDTIGGYGGSNWFGSSGGSSVADALYAWYGERSNYTAMSDDYLCNSFDSSATLTDGTSVSLQETGHFTQMVWNSSTSVGCAMASSCTNGLPEQYLCLYYPAGNVEADWYPGNLLNVFRPSQ